MCISMTVVTIIIATPLTLETLLSVATRSRQIEKRLFLLFTFGTSSFCLRLSSNSLAFTSIYRVYLIYRLPVALNSSSSLSLPPWLLGRIL